MSCKNCKTFKRQITHENWCAIFNELLLATSKGPLVYLSGDCPLSETKEHISNETKYFVRQNFMCTCGSRIEWGVCIRGTPFLRVRKK